MTQTNQIQLGTYCKDFRLHCVESENYFIEEIIGRGSYGVVLRAIDHSTHLRVAIKRVFSVFNDAFDGIRVLRELKFLRVLKHPNVIHLNTILTPRDPENFQDIYIVMEDMSGDLRSILHTHHTHNDMRLLMIQMLEGIDFLHAANVYHRDLKPQNILVDKATRKLKICDFGLSRLAYEGQHVKDMWTNYIVTRWYRAPELCGAEEYFYTKSIDIWSLGCIFAEMHLGYPLFKGDDSLHQLSLIIEGLGKPNDSVLRKHYCPEVRRVLKDKKITVLTNFLEGNLHDPNLIDLIYNMLCMDPSKRYSALQCICHPYFRDIRTSHYTSHFAKLNPKDFYFERDETLSIKGLRKLFLDEIRTHSCYRNQQHHKNVRGGLRDSLTRICVIHDTTESNDDGVNSGSLVSGSSQDDIDNHPEIFCLST